MSGARKISKAKGVEICVDRMFLGTPTKEIVREMAEEYGVSRSAVEKWMKAARPIVEERQQEAEAIRAREMEAAISESARRLNLTRERILEEYAKIAFSDVRKVYNESNGLLNIQSIEDETAGAVAGIESIDEVDREGNFVGTNRKVKLWNKQAALDSISKILGYFPQPTVKAKVEASGEGETRKISVTLNLG